MTAVISVPPCSSVTNLALKEARFLKARAMFEVIGERTRSSIVGRRIPRNVPPRDTPHHSSGFFKASGRDSRGRLTVKGGKGSAPPNRSIRHKHPRGKSRKVAPRKPRAPSCMVTSFRRLSGTSSSKSGVTLSPSAAGCEVQRQTLSQSLLAAC